jgi:ABC-type Fe3+/spermidine/putrescine transport system ATPase subunit
MNTSRQLPPHSGEEVVGLGKHEDKSRLVNFPRGKTCKAARPVNTLDFFMSSPSILTIAKVQKKYGEMIALHEISFDVVPGEFIALVGPSGSGKSTLLKCIAGFEDATGGSILIDGQAMEGVSPALRPTSMVFQKLALFPHKTIAENIGFPLKLRKKSKPEIAQAVDKMMALMSLNTSYLNRYPRQLSGGEQQRVALARSMISSPKLLLLDEPLSALDVKLKKVLQAELKRLHREVGVTFVHVTHDLEEAMMLADRICVMQSGRLDQIGTPYEIYYRPVTKFVAGFISETNLFDINVIRTGSGNFQFETDQFAGVKFTLDQTLAMDDLKAGAATLMVRPERLRPVKTARDADFTVAVKIEEYFIRGSTIQFVCVSADKSGRAHRLILEIRGESKLPFDIGDNVLLGFDKADSFTFQDKLDQNTSGKGMSGKGNVS